MKIRFFNNTWRWYMWRYHIFKDWLLVQTYPVLITSFLQPPQDVLWAKPVDFNQNLIAPAKEIQQKGHEIYSTYSVTQPAHTCKYIFKLVFLFSCWNHNLFHKTPKADNRFFFFASTIFDHNLLSLGRISIFNILYRFVLL